MMDYSKKERLYVVKIGGEVIDDDGSYENFIRSFSKIDALKVLVHGGGKIASQIGSQLGVTPQYHNGRRITDKDTLQLVTMVYAGWINKKIVSSLQQHHCNAIGLTGADGNILPAKKRASEPVDFGFVGDPQPALASQTTLPILLSSGLVPVIASLTHDQQGQLLNTNADTIASEIAVLLSQQYEVNLIYCFQKKGVLLDVNNPESVIPGIHRAEFEMLKATEKIYEGMLPKIETALSASERGVNKVLIGCAEDILLNITDGFHGTLIQSNQSI